MFYLSLLQELRKADSDFSFVCPQYTVGKIADPVTEPREAEIEHRKQEDVLKRLSVVCFILIFFYSYVIYFKLYYGHCELAYQIISQRYII